VEIGGLVVIEALALPSMSMVHKSELGESSITQSQMDLLLRPTTLSQFKRDLLV
jgi:hypothetical protein